MLSRSGCFLRRATGGAFVRTSGRFKSAIALSVRARVKPGYEDAFRKATITSAKKSIAQDIGLLRFDILQEEDDSREFLLFEVFKTKKDIVRHQETRHYQVWRSAVDEMMDGTRGIKTYKSIYPAFSKWSYPPNGKKRRRKRDPSLPKRPPNAYMLFAQNERETIKRANPNLSATEIMSELGRIWRSMAIDVKKPYEEEARRLKSDYDRITRALKNEEDA
eukprot:g801.t1